MAPPVQPTQPIQLTPRERPRIRAYRVTTGLAMLIYAVLLLVMHVRQVLMDGPHAGVIVWGRAFAAPIVFFAASAVYWLPPQKTLALTYLVAEAMVLLWLLRLWGG